MISSQTSVKWAVFSWLLVFEILLLVIVLNNPRFIDSLSGLVLFFILLPVALGVIWGILQVLLAGLCVKIFHTSLSEERLPARTISSLLAMGLSLFFIIWLFSSSRYESSTGTVVNVLLTVVIMAVGVGLYKLFATLFGSIIKRKRRLWLSGIHIVLILIIVLASLSPSLTNGKGGSGKDKVLIMGFDGASWNVLDPLVEKGEMPNLKKLMDSGAYGNLRSAQPLVSPLIWATIASGKTIEKHGVISFAYPSYYVKCSRIWDILERKGESIGLCGYFQTWPPWKTDGFIIPEHVAPGTETYPRSLGFVRELYLAAKNRRITPTTGILCGFSAVRNGLRLRTMRLAAASLLGRLFRRVDYFDLDEHYRKRILILRIHTDVFSHLTRTRPLDLEVFYTKVPDNVSHVYWKFMEAEKFGDVPEEEVARYSGVIDECYREFDKSIGQLLENIDDNTTVYVASDHGFRAAEWAGHTEAAMSYYVSSQKLMELIGLSSKVDAFHQARDIHVKVHANYTDETDGIVETLNSITVSDTGKRLFKVDKLFPGFIRMAVDSSNKNLLGKRIDLVDSQIEFSEIADRAQSLRISGSHAIDGVIVMKGPHVRRNQWLDSATIFDVTPTILYLLGMPVGEDMDGKVISQAISETYLEKNPITYVPTYDDREVEKEYIGDIAQYKEEELNQKLKEDLRALGYIR
jgi:predicted AlkP superfamily phosphohydrolase/phosphomutase